jgi:hypothetical protein
MKRLRRFIAVFLLLGLVTSIGVALLCAGVFDLIKGTQEGAHDGEWTVTTTTLPGAMGIRLRRAPASWSPQQATGVPDTPTAGDFTSAWASESHDGSTEWLMVEYDGEYVPKFIDVYESFNPGGLTRVTFVDDMGKETEVWSGDDPTPHGSGMGTSRIAINFPDGKVRATRRVKVYVGRAGYPEWNEIDAVGLIDEAGATHWAVEATASSWYGEAPSNPVTTSMESLVPAWSGLLPAMDKHGPRHSNWEERNVDARGWPMLALFSREDVVGHAQMSKSQYLSSPMFAPASAPPRKIVWPWRPIWGGLLVDSVLFGTVLAALWAMAVVPRRFFREVSRMKRGCCVACGYDLGYDFRGGCPECGWRRGDPP